MIIGIGMSCAQGSDPRWSRFPKGASHYRHMRDTDFCGELPLFAEADPTTMIGTVLDGARRYTDPKTGRQFRAVTVLAVVNGKRVDHWYRREKLVGHVYVLKNDPSFGHCGYWSEIEDPTTPLPQEVPAE
jgi:hypothetical protein